MDRAALGGENLAMGKKAKRPNIPNMVEVYCSQGHMRANAIQCRLVAAGIPAMLSYESVSRIYGLTVDGIGQVHVLVPEPFASQAKELLEDEQPEDIALPECPPQEGH